MTAILIKLCRQFRNNRLSFNFSIDPFQCWQDIRKVVKQKATQILQWNQRTGNAPCKMKLTPDEQKVYDIIGKEVLEGIEGVKESGLPQDHEEFHELSSDYEGMELENLPFSMTTYIHLYIYIQFYR